MKVTKIFFGLLAAIWMVALVSKVFADYSGRVDLAFSHHMAPVVAILTAATISISLFRGAFSN